MAAPHPDEPPFVHGRDLVPIRRDNPRYRDARREALFEAEDELRRELEEVDQELVNLTVERRRLLEAIEQLHDELRPSFVGARGRRPRAVTLEEPLPPIAARPRWLTGRPLRAICLAYLRRAPAPLTLRQLHVILHRAGYAIASGVPVKTLADALGHETVAGRAIRVRRGTYTIAKNVPPPRWEPANPDEAPPTPPDPAESEALLDPDDDPAADAAPPDPGTDAPPGGDRAEREPSGRTTVTPRTPLDAAAVPLPDF